LLKISKGKFVISKAEIKILKRFKDSKNERNIDEIFN